MDALDFLDTVWAAQGEGFAFISLRENGSANSWRDLAFKFPYDTIELPDPTLGDLYFCPNLFQRPRRRKELVLPSCWLYADLDAVVPQRVDAELSPTMAWESSPGRYQALWLIDKSLRREAHEQLNRTLTYALGADKGGWDITQVLRIPGTLNHKYADRPEVTLLWA